MKIETKVSGERLRELGVDSWSRWGCEVSRFSWEYDCTETCYLFEGEVTADDGERVRVCAGDLAVFPQGLRCEWNVLKPVRKAYQFS